MANPSRPLLIWSLPALAFLQALAGSFHALTGIGMSIEDRSDLSEPGGVPSDYAFTIWGLIFLWCLAFAIYQALPSQRDNRLLERLRAPAAAAFLINTVWELNAQLNSIEWLSFGIIVVLLSAALLSVVRVNRYRALIPTRDLWLAVVPLHILAGWISVAVFAHLSSSITATGLVPREDPATLLTSLLVLSASTVGASVIAKARVPAPYALTVAWGLAGVVVANIARQPNTTVAVAALVGAALVLAALAARTPRGGGTSRVAGPVS